MKAKPAPGKVKNPVEAVSAKAKVLTGAVATTVLAGAITGAGAMTGAGARIGAVLVTVTGVSE